MAREKSDGPIATNLRAKMRACGLSQTALAKAAGVARSQISKFMAGLDITLATADKLMEAVDKSYAERMKKETQTEEFRKTKREETNKTIRQYLQRHGDLSEAEDALWNLLDLIDALNGVIEEQSSDKD